MSLINKVLQDLDARNASASERAGLSPQLRALPPKKVYPWRVPVFAVLGAVAGGVVVWLVLQSGQTPAPAAPIIAAPSPPASIVTAPPAPAPIVAVAPPPPAIAAPVVEVPLPAEPETKPAPQAKPVKAVPSIVRGLGIDPSLKVDRRLGERYGANASPEPAAATGSGRIEKQSRGGASETAEAEYRKAMADVRRGATGDGIAGLRRALQLEPRFPVARQALLSLLVETQQWGEAQAACAEGLALDPSQSGWAMLQARLQVEKGDTALAAVTLAQYASAAERNADYQAFHALVLNRLQRPKEAAEHYRAALALRPAEGRWWYGLGLTLEADQRSQEAREAFQKARDTGNLTADMATTVEQKLH